MSKVSVIIPSRNEVFLQKTITDLINKASGEVEVIAVLDGYWPDPPLEDHKNLVVVHKGEAHGMRSAINLASGIASGDYLMKTDAHCLFAEGYDEVLKADCDDNWIVIPSRWSLDAENWCIENNRKPRRDYHYLCYPEKGKPHDSGMHGVEWWERGRERKDPQYDIDETMSFQGSCWFMKKSWFHDFLGGMSQTGYGSFSQEPQEIGNKTWLGGGKIMTNKKTWYAHLHKGKRYGRMYPMNMSEVVAAHNWSAEYWMYNRWKERVHDIEWLVDRFWPVPTWPENWRDIWYGNNSSQNS